MPVLRSDCAVGAPSLSRRSNSSAHSHTSNARALHLLFQGIPPEAKGTLGPAPACRKPPAGGFCTCFQTISFHQWDSRHGRFSLLHGSARSSLPCPSFFVFSILLFCSPTLLLLEIGTSFGINTTRCGIYFSLTMRFLESSRRGDTLQWGRFYEIKLTSYKRVSLN